MPRLLETLALPCFFALLVDVRATFYEKALMSVTVVS